MICVFMIFVWQLFVSFLSVYIFIADFTFSMVKTTMNLKISRRKKPWEIGIPEKESQTQLNKKFVLVAFKERTTEMKPTL